MSKHRRHRRSDFKIAHNPLRSSSSKKERKILFSEKFIAISPPCPDFYLDDFRLFTIPHEHYTNLATHGQLDFNSTFWYVWEMIRKKAKTLLRVERTFVRRLVIAMTESFAVKNTKKWNQFAQSEALEVGKNQFSIRTIPALLPEHFPSSHVSCFCFPFSFVLARMWTWRVVVAWKAHDWERPDWKSRLMRAQSGRLTFNLHHRLLSRCRSSYRREKRTPLSRT